MQIEKVLNNNVAVIKTEEGVETVIMGKGIAFQKKAGDKVDQDKIEKKFLLEGRDTNHKLQQLLMDIPMEHMLISEEIIQYAKSTFHKELNDSIYVTLTDHISSAIERFEEGIYLKNALLWDIRQFYPDEFKMALYAVSVLSEKTGMDFPEDEAGFIALHFVNAELDHQNMTAVHDMTRLIQEITGIVRAFFQIEYDVQSYAYFRFINHLKNFSQRLMSEESYEEDGIGLLDAVREQQSEAFQCVQQIRSYIEKNYGYATGADEMVYMTIHIARIIKEEKRS